MMDGLLPHVRDSTEGLHKTAQSQLKVTCPETAKEVLVLSAASRYVYGHQGGELGPHRCSSQLGELSSTGVSEPTHRVCQQKGGISELPLGISVRLGRRT